jgi:hypothetical protein
MVGQWHHGINRGVIPVELIVFYITAKDMLLEIKRIKSSVPSEGLNSLFKGTE